MHLNPVSMQTYSDQEATPILTYSPIPSHTLLNLDFSKQIILTEKISVHKMANSDKPLVVSFGEMLIDFVPDVAGVSLAESKAFLKAPGGAPANVACAISKLGGNSAFVGKVLLNNSFRFFPSFFLSIDFALMNLNNFVQKFITLKVSDLYTFATFARMRNLNVFVVKKKKTFGLLISTRM